MKNKGIFFSMVMMVAIAAVIVSCKPQSNIGGFYNYDSECLDVKGDGSQTLKAWGNGRNKEEAIEQAKKNALRDVLFKGIHNGRSNCESRPLIPEVNAKEKYESYFNSFFADGGAYKNFVAPENAPNYYYQLMKHRMKNASQKTYRVVIRVLRTDLKAKLIEDKILNP